MIQFSEVIKLKDGILYNLSYHQQRVNNTLKAYYNTCAIDLSLIGNSIPNDKKEGLYKLRILYSNKIESIEITPYTPKTIKNAALVYSNSIDYSYKFADRSAINTLAKSSSCNEIIIVKDSVITDSSAYNLVFECKDGLFTPSSYLLSGTKRAYLLNKEIIKQVNITPDDIKKYSRLYFINAMVDLQDNLSISTDDIVF